MSGCICSAGVGCGCLGRRLDGGGHRRWTRGHGAGHNGATRLDRLSWRWLADLRTEYVSYETWTWTTSHQRASQKYLHQNFKSKEKFFNSWINNIIHEEQSLYISEIFSSKSYIKWKMLYINNNKIHEEQLLHSENISIFVLMLLLVLRHWTYHRKGFCQMCNYFRIE